MSQLLIFPIKTRIYNDKDMVIINIRGILVDMLLDVAPGVYSLYITMDRKGIKKHISLFMNSI